jgi:hypothetical protein
MPLLVTYVVECSAGCPVSAGQARCSGRGWAASSSRAGCRRSASWCWRSRPSWVRRWSPWCGRRRRALPGPRYPKRLTSSRAGPAPETGSVLAVVADARRAEKPCPATTVRGPRRTLQPVCRPRRAAGRTTFEGPGASRPRRLRPGPRRHHSCGRSRPEGRNDSPRHPPHERAPSPAPMTGPRSWPPPEDRTDPFVLTGEQRHRAVRVVASASRDAGDCALLLAVLGLAAADGRPPEADAPGSAHAEPPEPHRRWRSTPQARRR